LVFPPFDWWKIAAPKVWLPTASEMANLDSVATSSGAIPERVLIENAGRAVAHALQERYPNGRVLVLAGGGHNGADALVAGRTLHMWGREVEVVQCGSRFPNPNVLAGWEFDILGPDFIAEALTRNDVVIDGILGTGFETAPRELQATIIERVNEAQVSVVSVDGPSGIDFTTGQTPGSAIHAELTITFGWPKLGLLRFPARSCCGDIVCVEIGFPPPTPLPRARAITASWAVELLGSRADNAYKGDAGYLTLIGGQSGMAGALILATEAAIRAGVGIVRVVSDGANREIIQSTVPDAVFVDWSDSTAVREAVIWADAIAIGPGLGCDTDRAELLNDTLAMRSSPIVVDADALNLIKGDLSSLATASDKGMLLTPHPGEMARLLGTSIALVQEDPPGITRELAQRTGATTLLKGAPTWIAEPNGDLRVTSIVSPAFASAGMGDVLTGTCGAYLATGLSPVDAATAALAITALAVSTKLDPVGSSSRDIPAAIVEARASLLEVIPGAWAGVVMAFPAACDGSAG
jgi:hydroxyethylthiazole kinase-like uncharacterized protein yjeF